MFTFERDFHNRRLETFQSSQHPCAVPSILYELFDHFHRIHCTQHFGVVEMLCETKSVHGLHEIHAHQAIEYAFEETYSRRVDK